MIDWQNIDTVLLDMDGTLLDLHFDNFFWLEYLPTRYAEEKAMSLPRANAIIMHHIDAQRGHLNWYCVDFWSQQLDIDIISLKQEIRHLIRFRPQSEAFLCQLKNSQLTTVMVTNAHPKSLILKQSLTRIGEYFDRVFSSHEFNVAKENFRFWTALQTALPFTPSRTLLIDDSLPVLQTARQYGIAHLIAILTPDSRKSARSLQDVDGFKGINRFDELHPTRINQRY